ncbi:transmembrane protein 147 isoform X2 [Daktulosphaira vitifoliae]|uniref:transmembrane protein 147 isoform X2 n=1 Tax=Daktulosphaira vitifoliae TaxID=58002 RepID=UPI0021AA4E3A|nr:transmembrane protein 147 isoform X2 [Daktulosphaira vitifoliae]
MSEYGAFWKCIQGGIIYAFTQLCKMLILATFFPTNDAAISTLSLANFIKSSVDLADIVGIFFILQSIPGKGHAKIITAGVGWAGAEILLTRFLLLWVGARGTEFDWKYIQKCLESNINLMHHIMTSALVWLWSRHDLSKIPSIISPVVAVIILIFFSVYRTPAIDLLNLWVVMDAWSIIVLKAIYTLTISLIVLKYYSGLTLLIGVY